MNNPSFFDLLEIKKQSLSKEIESWNKKIDSYFLSFDFLINPKLIENHFKKITHIGISSTTGSSKVINKIFEDSFVFQSTIKGAVEKINELSDLFSILFDLFDDRNNFFSSQKSVQKFINHFHSNKEKINSFNNSLKNYQILIKNHLDTLKTNTDDLLYQYILLDRDIMVLKKAQNLQKNTKISQLYNNYNYDLNIIQTDLLTEQQMLLQKYSALSLTKENLYNNYLNINNISKNTNNCLASIIELINLNTNNNEQLKNDLFKSLEQSFTQLLSFTKNKNPISNNNLFK